MPSESPATATVPRSPTRAARLRGALEHVSREPLRLVPVELSDRRTTRRVRRRESQYRLALTVSDAVAASIALFAVLAPLGSQRFAIALLVALPLLLVLGRLHGLYERDDMLIRKTTIDEIPRLFQHATLATLVLTLVSKRVGVGAISGTNVLVLWMLLLAAMVAGRLSVRFALMRAAEAERLLLLGDEHVAEALRTRVEGRVSVELVARASIESVRSPADLCAVLDETDADRVVIHSPTGAPAIETLELIRWAKASGVRVSLLPGLFGVVGTQVEFDDVFGLTLLGVRRFGLTRSSRVLKRAFDVVLGGVALALALPVIVVCALVIKLDSRGPVFFRQQRVGRGGRRFGIYKLRTMVDGAEHQRDQLLALNEAGAGMFKIADDPRQTRVGRLLRRTQLDELPQLLNVLRGEMSLVGPRPLVIDEDARITGLDRRRLELTPGMTGPWQILGSRRRVPMGEMLKLDYLYAANWSLWTDAKIIARTAALVLNRSGV